MLNIVNFIINTAGRFRVKKILLCYFLLKWAIGLYFYGLKYVLVFFETTHNGTHKHTKFWRHFCPVAMSNDAGIDVVSLIQSIGFRGLTFIFALWLLNEIACQERFSLIRLTTPNNLILASNFLNPFRYISLFHYNGSSRSMDTFLYFSKTKSFVELYEGVLASYKRQSNLC